MRTARQTKAVENLDEWYDSAVEQQQLMAVIGPRYTNMLNAIHGVVESTFPAMDEFRVDDAASRKLLNEAAERVVRIDQVTKEAIRDMLKVGQERGYSNWQLAYGVPDDKYRGIDGLFKETWRGRPDLVARTELQHAQVESSLDRYAATGLVDKVTMRDGTSDPLCAPRNGATVALADRPSLAHPACTLVVIPVLRENAPTLQWKPTMTEQEADAWSQGSAVPQASFHFTNEDAATKIKAGGFKTSDGAYGTGIYTTEDSQGRSIGRNANEAKLKVRINAKPDEIVKAQNMGDIADAADAAVGRESLKNNFEYDAGLALKSKGFKVIQLDRGDKEPWNIVLDHKALVVVS